MIKVRKPRIRFAPELGVVIMAALDTTKARWTLGTRFNVADHITSSIADTEFPAMRWFWVITFTLKDGDSSTTSAWALTPLTPLTPATIYLRGMFDNRNAFLILAPLREETISRIYKNIHLFIYLFIHSFIYSFIHPFIHSLIYWFIYSLFIY